MALFFGFHIVAMDLFVAPTIGFDLLYAFLITNWSETLS
jgi:hypothetical protein